MQSIWQTTGKAEFRIFMIDFQRPKLSDKDWIDDLLRRASERGCDYNFGTIYAWHEYYEIYVSEVEGCLAVRYGSGSRSAYLFPVGGNRRKAVIALKKDAAENGHQLVFYSVSKENVEFLEKEFPGEFTASLDRAGMDYLYEINNLAELSGRKYHGKKNHVNRFMKDNPDWSYEEMSPENIDECRAMDAVWVEQNLGFEGEDSLEGETEALRLCFDHFQELGLEGGVLRVRGRVVAFTIGEPICFGDTYDVHYEKAYADVAGAYSVINQQFARWVREHHPEVKYLNREEDLGLEGLRQAKESYHPAILLEEYVVRQQ